MLYTLQEGGARRREPAGPTEAQRKAELYKSKIQNNDKEFLEPFMQYGFDRSNKKIATMLEMVRKKIEQFCRSTEDMGFILAEEVANTVTKEQVIEWLRSRKEKRDTAIRDAEWQKKDESEIIKEAFEVSRGSLSATLKRARLLTDKKITMDDVRKWRLENANKEKKTNRKFYNSWVGNKAKDEYQVDLFFFQDLKKKQAMQELLEERAKEDPEAAEMLADDIPANDALEALPKAKAKSKAKAKAKAQDTVSKRSRELLQRIKELTWEYESGLLVVDTFSKKIAVVPMKNRDWPTLRVSLEAAFRRLGGKPASIYSDAEAALTSHEAQDYFRQQGIVHNITLAHAPVAERMIGVIKERIVDKIGKPQQMWWNYVDDVVDEYNGEHVSRSTHMTPDTAHKPENTTEVKTNLEAIRKMDNPQPTINVGDEVRVMIKNKFDKSYVPDWTDKTYKVTEKKEMNHVYGEDDRPVDPQVMYQLSDPTHDLPRYKRRFMRHELLRVK